MPHSDEISLLSEWVAKMRSGEVPAELVAAKSGIAAQYDRFDEIMRGDAPPRIYGVNTLPGHREGEPMPAGYAASYQRNLIENHCLPQTEFVDAETARFIHLSKCRTISSGGSLISPDLYEILLDLAGDPGFAPDIPKGATYSSGDVIPAAYWARAVLTHRPEYELKPGEGMALINGAFIHIGTALAAFARLVQVWDSYLTVSRRFFAHVPANDALLIHAAPNRVAAAQSYVIEPSEFPTPGSLQPPVSVRAFPQTLRAFHDSIAGLARQILLTLSQPSSNPRIGQTDQGEARILPSGTFVAPGLSLATGQVTDSLLMVGWTIVRRMEFFLSGEVAGIARDGTDSTDPIGLIQWPKLAVAELERMRMLYSRRVFGSGGATSYGVEDFWTHGTLTAHQMMACAETLETVLGLEHEIQDRVGRSEPGQTDRRADAGTATLPNSARLV